MILADLEDWKDRWMSTMHTVLLLLLQRSLINQQTQEPCCPDVSLCLFLWFFLHRHVRLRRAQQQVVPRSQPHHPPRSWQNVNGISMKDVVRGV